MRSVFYRVNPLNWSTRTVKILTAAFFAIMVPTYIFIGLQPKDAANSASYPTLNIPAINLSTPVEPLELTDNQLIAPNTIAGSFSNASNKTLIIGHKTTVFSNLNSLKTSNLIIYNGQTYKITKLATLKKSNVDMNEILAPATTPTIILMTCAGDQISTTDFTHRLIITAVLQE